MFWISQMVIVGTFPVRGTEREVIDVVWDAYGYRFGSGVSADDSYLWIGIEFLGYKVFDGSLLRRLQISLMWMNKVNQIR